jgi:DNA-binding response OmpR family regulator
MKFLVVEDYSRLSEIVSSWLKDLGYAVDAAGTVADAREYLANSHYDLVILDLGLPDEDGSVLIREIHARRQGPPVLVTTARGALDDRVHGLELGADDYLVKPFHMSELLARCRAILRRPGGVLEHVLTVGNLDYDVNTGEVRIGGELIQVTPKELTALGLLMRRPGRVIAREAFEEGLGRSGRILSRNAVEAVVSRLRRRLTAAQSSATVETVRGVGYMLRSDGDAP